jgi:hypothetical protein
LETEKYNVLLLQSHTKIVIMQSWKLVALSMEPIPFLLAMKKRAFLSFVLFYYFSCHYFRHQIFGFRFVAFVAQYSVFLPISAIETLSD